MKAGGKSVRGPFPPLVLGGFVPCPDCGQNITTKVSDRYLQGRDCPTCWRELQAFRDLVNS